MYKIKKKKCEQPQSKLYLAKENNQIHTLQDRFRFDKSQTRGFGDSHAHSHQSLFIGPCCICWLKQDDRALATSLTSPQDI